MKMASNNRFKIVKSTSHKPNRVYVDKVNRKLRIFYDPAYDLSIQSKKRPSPLKSSNIKGLKNTHRCQGDPGCKHGCEPFYGKIVLHNNYASLDINRIRSTESPEMQLVVHNPASPESIERIDTSSDSEAEEDDEVPIKLECIEQPLKFETEKEAGWTSMTNSGSEAPCGTPTRKLYGSRNSYSREVNRRFREEQTAFGRWPEHGEFFGMSLGESRKATEVVIREGLRSKGVVV